MTQHAAFKNTKQLTGQPKKREGREGGGGRSGLLFPRLSFFFEAQQLLSYTTTHPFHPPPPHLHTALPLLVFSMPGAAKAFLAAQHAGWFFCQHGEPCFCRSLLLLHIHTPVHVCHVAGDCLPPRFFCCLLTKHTREGRGEGERVWPPPASTQAGTAGTSVLSLSLPLALVWGGGSCSVQCAVFFAFGGATLKKKKREEYRQSDTHKRMLGRRTRGGRGGKKAGRRFSDTPPSKLHHTLASAAAAD